MRTFCAGLAIAAFAALNPESAYGQTNCPGTTAGAQFAGANSQLAWLQYIASELRKVRLELLEDRKEAQQARMRDLEHDLEVIQNKERGLEEEQHSQIQQAADIEGQLAQPSLTKAEREELEAQKADVLNISPARYSTPQAVLSQRETHARDRLAEQEQRLRQIERQIRELSSAQ